VSRPSRMVSQVLFPLVHQLRRLFKSCNQSLQKLVSEWHGPPMQRW
jgi:hypothetical protein